MNDNAPVFLGTPYVLNISELSPVGSVLFSDVLAVDGDQQGPFSMVEYNIQNGPFSDYVALENPLDGKLIQTKSFDYEKVQQLDIKVIARDKGSPPHVPPEANAIYNATTWLTHWCCCPASSAPPHSTRSKTWASFSNFLGAAAHFWHLSGIGSQAPSKLLQLPAGCRYSCIIVMMHHLDVTMALYMRDRTICL